MSAYHYIPDEKWFAKLKNLFTMKNTKNFLSFLLLLCGSYFSYSFLLTDATVSIDGVVVVEKGKLKL